MADEVTLQVGVKALLKNADGKYLLIHRSAEKYPEVPNPWDIPGGRIQPGTPLLDNLQREIQEETGLGVTGTPRLIGAQDILRIAGRHVVRLTYLVETQGEPVLSEEHDAHRWVTLAEMAEVDKLDKYTKEVIETAMVE